jgi:hypothetical protein
MEGYWREAAGKDRIPGFGKQRLLARCLKSTTLPRALRLALRGGFLGTPHYRFLPRPAEDRPPGGAANVIEDRVTSAVLV